MLFHKETVQETIQEYNQVYYIVIYNYKSLLFFVDHLGSFWFPLISLQYEIQIADFLKLNLQKSLINCATVTLFLHVNF